MDDYFTYIGTDASSSAATPITPQPFAKPGQGVTSTSSSSGFAIAPLGATHIVLTETAATPATHANEAFQQTAKEYKKAGVKVIIRRYGK